MKEERIKQLEELYAAKVQAKAEEISKWIYEHPPATVPCRQAP